MTTRDGLLFVRTGKGPMKRWSRRLLVLNQRQLIVYGSTSTPLVHEIVDLGTIVSCAVSSDSPELDQFVVVINVDRLKPRILRFLAESGQACEDWVEAIGLAIVPRRRSVETCTMAPSSISAKKRLSLPVIITEFGSQPMSRNRMLHYQQSMSIASPIVATPPSFLAAGPAPISSDPSQRHSRLRSSVSSIEASSSPGEFRQRLLCIVNDVGSLEAQLLVQLLGTDTMILKRMLEVANQTRPERNPSAGKNIQTEIHSILRYVLLDPRLEVLLEAAPDEDDSELSALAVQIKWQLIKGKPGARDKFSDFLVEHLYGDRFSERVAEAVLSCLKGPKTQRFPKLLRYPQIWKGLLLSTVHAPLNVKNIVFRELTWLLLDDPTNAQTIILQPDWLEWVLQPIAFDQLNQSLQDEHMHLRMHFVVLVHFDMMFTSSHFGDLLKSSMSQFRRLNQSNRVTAAVFLECLIAKAIKQKHRFAIQHEEQHAESLMQLSDMIIAFAFCSADWKKTDIGTGKDALVPLEYWDYRLVLNSPHLSYRIGFNLDSLELADSMLALLTGLGFGHEDEASALQSAHTQQERAIVNRFIAARDLLRDSLLLLNVLSSRGASLSMESHIRPQIRQFLQSTSSIKRIEICAKDTIVPQGESPTPDLQRLLQHLVHRNMASSLSLDSVVCMVRFKLKSEFTTSALVEALCDLQIVARPIFAHSILLVLLLANIIHPLNWKTMTSPIAPYQMYRLSPTPEMSVYDLKSSVEDLSSNGSKTILSSRPSLTEDASITI